MLRTVKILNHRVQSKLDSKWSNLKNSQMAKEMEMTLVKTLTKRSWTPRYLSILFQGWYWILWTEFCFKRQLQRIEGYMYYREFIWKSNWPFFPQEGRELGLYSLGKESAIHLREPDRSKRKKWIETCVWRSYSTVFYF